MEEFFLNLKHRIDELPSGRVSLLREKLNEVYDFLKIKDKFKRWNRIFKAETHTPKMYALELKAICEVLDISHDELFDPGFSFLDAELRLRKKEQDEVARKFRLKKAS